MSKERNVKVTATFEVHFPAATWERRPGVGQRLDDASSDRLATAIHAAFEQGDPSDEMNAVIEVDTYAARMIGDDA